MLNLLSANKKISEVLKEQNNQVVYQAWLSCTESAQLVDNNLVLSVPNHFIREGIEDRYISEISELYKNEVNFSKIVIKVSTELETIDERPSALEYINDKFIDVVEAINSQIKEVYSFIETAVKEGSHSVSCALAKEAIATEEIYFRVKEFLSDKGYKAELFNSGSNFTLNLSW